jgi:hypothetical protein
MNLDLYAADHTILPSLADRKPGDDLEGFYGCKATWPTESKCGRTAHARLGGTAPAGRRSHLPRGCRVAAALPTCGRGIRGVHAPP